MISSSNIGRREVRSRLCVPGLLAAGVLSVSVLGLGACQKEIADTEPGEPMGKVGLGQHAGRYLVAVCDADISPESIMTSDLGELDPRGKDMLTILPLPIMEPTTPYAQIPVSNSALGSPTCLAVSPDGNYAYVVETKGPATRANGDRQTVARTVEDLPPGENLTIVDLREPLNPKVTQKQYVGTEPVSVSVSPGGDLVAVATGMAGNQLVICEVNNGSLMKGPQTWGLAGFEDEEARPWSIAWQPVAEGVTGVQEGATLAVTVPGRDSVVFYHVMRDAQRELIVAPLGEPVRVGKHPTVGAFTPDGKYFVCICTNQAGMGFEVGTPPGQVCVVRVGEGMSKTPQKTLTLAHSHEVVSMASVGVRPQDMAVSSDGRFIVTANLQGAAVTDVQSVQDRGMQTSTGKTQGGSLSLLAFDAATGRVETIGEYPINAVPAGVSFDAQNQLLAVTQFQSFDPSAVDGEVAFWELVTSRRARLEPKKFFVGVGNGPHGVRIVK